MQWCPWYQRMSILKSNGEQVSKRPKSISSDDLLRLYGCPGPKRSSIAMYDGREEEKREREGVKEGGREGGKTDRRRRSNKAIGWS